jgi:hypothetical protein
MHFKKGNYNCRDAGAQIPIAIGTTKTQRPQRNVKSRRVHCVLSVFVGYSLNDQKFIFRDPPLLS